MQRLQGPDKIINHIARIQRQEASDSGNLLRKTCTQNVDAQGKNLMDMPIPRNFDLMRPLIPNPPGVTRNNYVWWVLDGVDFLMEPALPAAPSARELLSRRAELLGRLQAPQEHEASSDSETDLLVWSIELSPLDCCWAFQR